jgi:hypothetical protein
VFMFTEEKRELHTPLMRMLRNFLLVKSSIGKFLRYVQKYLFVLASDNAHVQTNYSGFL